jgi:uncharacterized RDD family membrane protein YckC
MRMTADEPSAVHDAFPPFEVDTRFEVEAPEHITIEYDLAGLGSRFVALVLDLLIQSLAIMLLVLAAWLATALLDVNVSENEDLWLALAVIGVLLINVGYHLVFEAIWGGHTPGKRAVGIRVLRDRGTPISFWDSAIRNLVRLVDSLPALYAVGLLSVFISKRRKRLGDYAAGTIVVRERSAALPPPPPPPRPAAPEWERYAAAYEARLTREEGAAIARFLARRSELEPDARVLLGWRLLRALSDRLPLGGMGHDWQQNEALLEALDRVRTQRRHRRLRAGQTGTAGPPPPGPSG